MTGMRVTSRVLGYDVLAIVLSRNEPGDYPDYIQ
jgi:hypothetical protein